MDDERGVGARGVVYSEKQRFTQWWLWLLLAGVAGLGWWLFVEQLVLGHPVGDEPLPDWAAWLLWALMGVGLPAFFGSIALFTEVTSDRIILHYRPMRTRIILLADIKEVTVRTYSPVREYGGWGIKGWSVRNVAYNVSGDRGVQLVLGNERKVLVGSRRPEELAAAIDTGRGVARDQRVG